MEVDAAKVVPAPVEDLVAAAAALSAGPGAAAATAWRSARWASVAAVGLPALSLAAVLVAYVLYYVLNYLSTGELLMIYKWQPAPFGWAMLVGFATLVVVSLLTPAEDPARIEAYFDRMRHLSASDRTAGASALADDHGQALILLDIGTWLQPERWRNFWSRYREDALGFLLAWGFVGLLVAIAWGVMRL